jgi:hypothetical protein
MNIIITILLIVAGIIALLLILGLFMKKDHYVRREIIIRAPRQKVFDYVRFLKNQDSFNKHAMVEPDRKKEFKGQTEQLDMFMHGAGAKVPVKEKKKLRTLLKGKESRQRSVLQNQWQSAPW